MRPYEQNLRFSLPYLGPGQKLDTLLMTLVAGTVATGTVEGHLLMVLLIMMKEYLLLRNIPNSRLECKTHTLFMTKMAKMAHTYNSPYKGVLLPSPPIGLILV